MMRIGVVLALLAGSAEICRADGGPPIPGVQSAFVTIRIITNHNHPDYLFILGPDHREYPAHFIEVAPDKPFTVPNTYFHVADVVIVRRSSLKPGQTAEEIYNDRTIPGRKQYSLTLRESVPVWYGREYVVSYRIQKASIDDQLELVQTTVSPLWQCSVVGIFGPLAIILGGLWLVRKRRRR